MNYVLQYFSNNWVYDILNQVNKSHKVIHIRCLSYIIIEVCLKWFIFMFYINMDTGVAGSYFYWQRVVIDIFQQLDIVWLQRWIWSLIISIICESSIPGVSAQLEYVRLNHFIVLSKCPMVSFY